MKKIATLLLLFSMGNVFANCAIPGWPGCTYEDFQNAMQVQQQLNIQQQQLRELQRANQLTQQLIEQQEQQQIMNMIMQRPIIDPQNYYIQQNQIRCLNMPLRTPGC